MTDFHTRKNKQLSITDIHCLTDFVKERMERWKRMREAINKFDMHILFFARIEK